MVLAELEAFLSRPVAPTRRVALGSLDLPGDPAPGFGGILLGGIAGIAVSQRRLEDAYSPAVEHRGEEVLVAHVQRGAIHNPNIRRTEFHRRRDRDVITDLEAQVRDVFEAHHGHLIDA